MLSKITSASTLGVEAYMVEVEADIQQQLPAFVTVGLPEGAVRESKERVTSAIKNSDFVFPAKRVTINLAPADIKKEAPLLICRLRSYSRRYRADSQRPFR